MKAQPKNTLPRRVHVIGICGVATSALAIALSKRGVEVTGSDKGFFPPVSTELASEGIRFHAGWHPEKISEGGRPDVVIAGGSGTSPSNPETMYAKENGIPVLSFAEALGQYVVKEKSIVTAGTWGKTTNSALLAHILRAGGMDPSCFSGGIPLSGSAARITDSEWSVVEGDEYQAGISDRKAKFFYYRPRYLLLSGVSWDHADLYPSEETYFEAFKKLLKEIPKNGMVVACRDHAGVTKALGSFKGTVVEYGRGGDGRAAFAYENVRQSKEGLDFNIRHETASWAIHSPMLGLYQSENITGCFALAHEIGVKAETIREAIGEFKGIKRRLEKRQNGNIAVYDDIAHSPEKAAPVLQTLQSIYSGKVIAVFEPNIGARQRQAGEKYAHAFASANIVIIPRLSKLKVAQGETEKPMEGDEIAALIRKDHSAVHYAEDDEELVSFIRANAKKDDVIVFLGSHGWRGMIEKTIEAIS